MFNFLLGVIIFCTNQVLASELIVWQTEKSDRSKAIKSMHEHVASVEIEKMRQKSLVALRMHREAFPCLIKNWERSKKIYLLDKNHSGWNCCGNEKWCAECRLKAKVERDFIAARQELDDLLEKLHSVDREIEEMVRNFKKNISRGLTTQKQRKAFTAMRQAKLQDSKRFNVDLLRFYESEHAEAEELFRKGA